MHGFLEPRDDTPQRKSRQPKTNKTNEKVDNKAVGGHWEGQQQARAGPTVERCERCWNFHIRLSVTESPRSAVSLRHTWAAIGPQPPMAPACATAPAASVERLFILFRPSFPFCLRSSHHQDQGPGPGPAQAPSASSKQQAALSAVRTHDATAGRIDASVLPCNSALSHCTTTLLDGCCCCCAAGDARRAKVEGSEDEMR